MCKTKKNNNNNNSHHHKMSVMMSKIRDFFQYFLLAMWTDRQYTLCLIEIEIEIAYAHTLLEVEFPKANFSIFSIDYPDHLDYPDYILIIQKRKKKMDRERHERLFRIWDAILQAPPIRFLEVIKSIVEFFILFMIVFFIHKQLYYFFIYYLD